ncbi:homocysteine-responsive endoplasmic reticulum-resident ubiquitin-like domain member 2 protein isoform 4-T5 [Thomomys bottae]
MDPSGMEIPVTLVIKAPNQKYRDQTVSCFLNWTVGKLKSHLSSVYPSKPVSAAGLSVNPSKPLTKDQRLVYSGRLLPDHLQLKDILRKSSDHSGSTTPSSSSQETLSLAAAATTTASSSPDGLRQRILAQAQTDPRQNPQFPYMVQGNVDNQLPGQAAPAGLPAYPAFSPLHMLWWHQLYARHYYLHYQAAISAQATSNASPGQPIASQPLNLAHGPGEEPPPAANLGAQEDRPINENVQMNAQGGPVLNEDDFNRDWLDWVYTFSRAAILLSVVYFYSSFSRFIVVMGAMLLVYLHQAGWFPFRQEGGQQQAPNDVRANHQRQNANNPELEEMERLMDDGQEDESGEDAGDDTNVGPRPGLVASAWSFITTFFTSLIPEGPPQVAN